MRIFTVGHSTRSLAELVALLRSYEVTRIVDIRTVPRSRTNPHFNREAMPEAVAGSGLDYIHLAGLGGLRGKIAGVPPTRNAAWENASFHRYADYATTPPFAVALDELVAMAGTRTCALMCAEAVWWRCHRRIVADHLLVRGVDVVHLLGAAKATPATLTPFAVVRGHRVTYPARAVAPSRGSAAPA